MTDRGERDGQPDRAQADIGQVHGRQQPHREPRHLAQSAATPGPRSREVAAELRRERASTSTGQSDQRGAPSPASAKTDRRTNRVPGIGHRHDGTIRRARCREESAAAPRGRGPRRRAAAPSRARARTASGRARAGSASRSRPPTSNSIRDVSAYSATNSSDHGRRAAPTARREHGQRHRGEQERRAPRSPRRAARVRDIRVPSRGRKCDSSRWTPAERSRPGRGAARVVASSIRVPMVPSRNRQKRRNIQMPAARFDQLFTSRIGLVARTNVQSGPRALSQARRRRRWRQQQGCSWQTRREAGTQSLRSRVLRDSSAASLSSNGFKDESHDGRSSMIRRTRAAFLAALSALSARRPRSSGCERQPALDPPGIVRQPAGVPAVRPVRRLQQLHAGARRELRVRRCPVGSDRRRSRRRRQRELQRRRCRRLAARSRCPPAARPRVPFSCTDIYHPTVRLFVRNTGSAVLAPEGLRDLPDAAWGMR